MRIHRLGSIRWEKLLWVCPVLSPRSAEIGPLSTEIATAEYSVKWLAEPVFAKRPGGRRWARNLCASHPILQEHYGSWLEGAPFG